MAADSSDPLLRLPEGVAHFNASRYWEAHESWEASWLQSTGAPRQFLQGLIQAAAALHQLRRGRFRGAARLAAAAAARLAAQPHGYLGVDRTEVVAALALLQTVLPDAPPAVPPHPLLLLEEGWELAVRRDFDSGTGDRDRGFVKREPGDQEA